MKTASVSQLKSSLSAYLVGVKKGEEILVTERGRPIARLVPALDAETSSDRKYRLVRSGVLRAGSLRLPSDLLKPSAVRDVEGRVVGALLEERREGR